MTTWPLPSAQFSSPHAGFSCGLRPYFFVTVHGRMSAASMVVISFSITLGVDLSSEIRSSTRLSGSLNNGMPVASRARGPRRPRVSTLSGSDQPLLSASGLFSDGIALQRRMNLCRKGAAIGEDAAAVVNVLDENVGRVGRDDELHGAVRRHHARHARRQAHRGRIVALSAFRLVLHAGLHDGL